MSGSFTGFSEDDIRNFNQKKQTKTFPNNSIQDKRKRPKKIISNEISSEKPPDDELQKNNTNNDELQKNNTNNNESSNVTLKTIQIESTHIQENEQVIEAMLVPVDKKINLEEFQAKQKLIEEQNRKRKELLSKALAVKTKQTQEEANKLKAIKEEFKKLDALLSTDVKILRKQIEVASLDYTEAQKRYYRIEKEFLDAKFVLHQKLERKEMLTEHLCAIVERNEERKAEKLDELLLKLNLKTETEEIATSINTKESDNHNTV